MLCRAREYFFALVGQASRSVSTPALDLLAERLRARLDRPGGCPYARWFVDPAVLCARLGWQVVIARPGFSGPLGPSQLLIPDVGSALLTNLNLLEALCDRMIRGAHPVYARADVVALAGTLAVSRKHAARASLDDVLTLQRNLPHDVVMGCWNAARAMEPEPEERTTNTRRKKRAAN